MRIPKSRIPKGRVSITLPEDILLDVRKAATRRHVSLSEQIQDIIKAWYSQMKQDYLLGDKK